MAVETLRINITADNASAIKALNETIKGVEGIENAHKKQTIAIEQVNFVINKLTEKLSLLKNQLKNVEEGGRSFNILQNSIKKTESELDVLNNLSSKFSPKIEEGADKASFKIGGLYNKVRQLAYILPGIGMAGLFNLAFEGIGKLAEGLGLFSTKSTEAAKAQKEFNDELNKQVVSGASEISHLKALEAVASDTALAMGKRLLAVKELRDKYPAYFKDLTNEQILTGNVATVTDSLTKAIYARAEARAREADIAKKAGKVFENNQRIEQIGVELVKARAEKGRGQSMVGGGSLGGISSATDAGYDRSLAKENSLLNEAYKLKLDNAQLDLDIYSSQLKLNSAEEKSIDLDTKKERSLKAKKTEAEKWAEFLKKFQGKMAAEQAASMNLPQVFAPKDKEAKATPLPKSTDFDRNPYKKLYSDIDKRNQKEINDGLRDSAKLANIGADAFKTLFDSMAGGESIGQAIANVFKDLLKQLIGMVVKAIAFAVIFNVISGGAFSIGKIFMGALGGNFTGKGYAQGGLSTGPQSGHMELLHGNEWVLRPEQLNGALMAAKNMGAISGGSVGGQTINVVGKIMGQDIWLSKQRTDYNRGLTT